MNTNFPDDLNYYTKKVENEADSLGRKRTQDAKG